MIVAFQTAQKLDWRGWVLGIMGAVISGGAGAFSTGLGGVIMGAQDPDQWLLHGNHLPKLMVATFAGSAVVSLMKWLQTHPVPEPLTINTSGNVTVNQPNATGNK